MVLKATLSKRNSEKIFFALNDFVIVGAGAQILGPITVGRCARVGGNSVVTKDVPEGMTVVGVPARQLNKSNTSQPDQSNFTPYAFNAGLDSDPRERTIRFLLEEMKKQNARLIELELKSLSAHLSKPSGKEARRSKQKP